MTYGMHKATFLVYFANLRERGMFFCMRKMQRENFFPFLVTSLFCKCILRFFIYSCLFMLGGLNQQRKPPSKRGPPALQKRGNVSDWQVKDREEPEPEIKREDDGGKEAKTVIRFGHFTFTQ